MRTGAQLIWRNFHLSCLLVHHGVVVSDSFPSQFQKLWYPEAIVQVCLSFMFIVISSVWSKLQMHLVTRAIIVSHTDFMHTMSKLLQFSPPAPIYSILCAGAAEVSLLFIWPFWAPLPQELALPAKLLLVLPMPPPLQSIVSPYIPRPMISYLRHSLVTN